MRARRWVRRSGHPDGRGVFAEGHAIHAPIQYGWHTGGCNRLPGGDDARVGHRPGLRPGEECRERTTKHTDRDPHMGILSIEYVRDVIAPTRTAVTWPFLASSASRVFRSAGAAVHNADARCTIPTRSPDRSVQHCWRTATLFASAGVITQAHAVSRPGYLRMGLGLGFRSGHRFRSTCRETFAV